MSSISHDDPYNAKMRKRIKEYNEITASSNPPMMVMDSPTRRGHIVHGSNAYSEPMVEGGKKKKGLAKTLKTIGQFVKPVAQPILQAATRRAVHEIDTYGGAPYKRKEKHELKPKVADWIDEVKAVQEAQGCTYKAAMSIASKARHERNGTKAVKNPRTQAQKDATKARRAAKKAALSAAASGEEPEDTQLVPLGSGRRRYYR